MTATTQRRRWTIQPGRQEARTGCTGAAVGTAARPAAGRVPRRGPTRPAPYLGFRLARTVSSPSPINFFGGSRPPLICSALDAVTQGRELSLRFRLVHLRPPVPRASEPPSGQPIPLFPDPQAGPPPDVRGLFPASNAARGRQRRSGLRSVPEWSLCLPLKVARMFATDLATVEDWLWPQRKKMPRRSSGSWAIVVRFSSASWESFRPWSSLGVL